MVGGARTRSTVVAAIGRASAPERSRGSSASRTPSPIRLIDITMRRIIAPGTIAGVRGGDQGRARLAEHRAQVGLRRLRPEAEKGQPGGLEDHPADRGGHRDDDHRQDVGQHFGQDDPAVPEARQARGVDELALGDGDGHAPDVAREERHVDGRNRDQRVQQARAERRHDGERQQDVGKGHQHVDAAHDDVVGAAADIARDHTDRRPDDAGQHRRREADRERKAGAPQKTAEQVAAEVVGAKQVSRGERARETVAGVDHVRVGQRQHGDQEDQRDDRAQHDRAEPRESVPEQQRQEQPHVRILGSRRLCATSTQMLKST